MKRALICCTALLIVLSCSRMSSPTEPVTGTGKLVVTVHEDGSSVGIGNVTIEIRQEENGPIVMTGMTSASGVFEIFLPARTYWVRVVPPAGYSFAAGKAELLGNSIPVAAGGTSGITLSLSRQ